MAALVLLPGMDGTGELFGPLLPHVDPRLRCQVVRYPTWTVKCYEELAELVSDALPADEPFVLLGESFSGPVAMQVAAGNPPALRGLILCCTFVRNPRPALSWLGRMATAFPARPPPGIVAPLLFGRYSTPALRAAAARSVAQVDGNVLRARTREVLDVDVRESLRRVTAPLLCLEASEDLLVPRSALQSILAIRPDARVARLAGPHGLLQARPADAAAAIHRFIRDDCGLIPPGPAANP